MSTAADLTPPARQILTPAQLNAMARDLLEGAFPMVWVEGELSNLARPASGHLYFSLKDPRAQIRCAMFKPKSQRLAFRPVDGQQVVLRGRISLYEPRGDYQLLVDHLEEAGEGALRRAFELLKQKLQAEGLFDAARKKPLPAFVRRLGILSSPSGAAIRDVLHVLARRFPLIDVELLPVPVQGAPAAAEILRMLRRADACGRYDALLLTRGGGSLEDLWSFNDEALARAIAELRTPLVCAVGHEIDHSIADWVADLRAPTPSAAAELLTPDGAQLLLRLDTQQRRLQLAHQRQMRNTAQRLDTLLVRLDAQRPQARLERGRARLAALQVRLQHALRQRVSQRSRDLDRWRLRLQRLHPQARVERLAGRAERSQRLLRHLAERLLAERRNRCVALARTLNSVSPLATLSRGYAILLDEQQDRSLRSVTELAVGRRIRARVHDGEAALLVTASSATPAAGNGPIKGNNR